MAFSPDGRTALTVTNTGAVRLWDAGTGKPLGRPLDHRGQDLAGQNLVFAFSPDGRSLLTAGPGWARLWDVAELPGSLPRIATWVEVITGLWADEQGRDPGSSTMPVGSERVKRLLGAPRRVLLTVRAPVVASLGTQSSTRGPDCSRPVFCSRRAAPLGGCREGI